MGVGSCCDFWNFLIVPVTLYFVVAALGPTG